MTTFEFEQELHRRKDSELATARRERDEASEMSRANLLVAQELETQAKNSDSAHEVVVKFYEGQIRILEGKIRIMESKLRLEEATSKIYKSTANRLAGQLSDSKIMKAIEEQNNEKSTGETKDE